MTAADIAFARLPVRGGLSGAIMLSALMAGMFVAETSRQHARSLPVLPGGPPIRCVRISGLWRADKPNEDQPIASLPI